MLTRYKNVLMSSDPNAAGGGLGGDSGGDAGAQESTSGQGDAGDSGTSDGGALGKTDGEGDLVEDFNLEDFLAHDPFKKPDVKGEAESGASGQQGDAESTGQDQQQPPQDKTGQTGQGQQQPAQGDGKEPGQQQKDSPEMVLLREQVKNLTQLLNQQQQAANQAAPQAGDQQASAGQRTPEQIQQARHEAVAKTLPAYQFQIPDTVMAKMGSDDPNQIRAGLGEFAQGVAQVAHYNVMMQMEERIENLRQELLKESVTTFQRTTQAEQKATEARSAISKDFYGAFPELNRPELKLFIQQQAKVLAQQYGVTGWNEQFRDMLGARVKEILGNSAQGPSPDANGSQNNGQQQQQRQKQRFNAGSGQGRSQTSQDDIVSDIADTLLG